jgi:co-chaperonin GroES (HSP10)
MKPKVKKYKISKEDLDAIQIPHDSNMVIVKITHMNAESKTKSGIILIGDEDFKPAIHAERWGYIHRACPNLYYEPKTPGSMPWETDVEVEEGDKVWFDFNQALQAYTYECEGVLYKLMSYQFLHMAQKPNSDVLPLNGYVLFTEFEPKVESDILLTTNIDKKYGVVEYVGTPNRDYEVNHMFDYNYYDGIDLSPGDHVLFESGTSCFPLESGMHNEFSDTRYVMQQRKRIVAVVNKEHTRAERLHKMVVAVEIIGEKKSDSGIKLIKSQKTHRIGRVVESSHPDMPIGTVCSLPQKKGTEFNGLEYYTEDRVLYYEATA